MEFEVNDTVVNIVVKWLLALWKSVESTGINTPIDVRVVEGYGSTPFVELKC